MDMYSGDTTLNSLQLYSGELSVVSPDKLH